MSPKYIIFLVSIFIFYSTASAGGTAPFSHRLPRPLLRERMTSFIKVEEAPFPSRLHGHLQRETAMPFKQEVETQPFPYRLQWQQDVVLSHALLWLAIPSHYLRNAQPQPAMHSIQRLQKNKVNGLDRIAIDRYDANAIRLSNLPRDVVCYAPLALMVPPLVKKQWSAVLTITVMYMEAMQINKSLASCVKSLTHRPRPYLYGSRLTMEEKLARGREGFRSFYSGHTSDAFCSALFLSTVYEKIYPQSPYKRYVYGLSLMLATSTGLLRISGGKHFPTDVLAGACMGGLIGYAIPRLHEIKVAGSVRLSPYIHDHFGLSVIIDLKNAQC